MYVVLPVEVQRLGQALDVDDVRQAVLGELQDGEAVWYAPAGPERHDLQGESRALARCTQVAELFEVGLSACYGLAQRGLVQDDPELQLAVAEPALPLLAQLDELAGVLGPGMKFCS